MLESYAQTVMTGGTKMLSLDVEKVKERALRPWSRINPNTKLKAKRVLAVLEQDNFQCVRCGCTKNLTIDHITPKRHLDGKKYSYLNITLDNCQTLCVDCHMKKNRREQEYENQKTNTMD